MPFLPCSVNGVRGGFSDTLWAMDIREQFEENKVLAPYCTYQIGGPADLFFEAESVKDALAAIEWAEEHDVPLFVFGGGSNLLFDDAGFRGLVLRMRVREIEVDGHLIHAGAGAKAGEVVKAALEAGLTGLESWNGLPGTVGGAVYGNAGCFEVECKDVLESALIYMAGEGVEEVNPYFFEYDYRNSKLKREPAVVLQATFKLNQGDPVEIKSRMMEILKLRATKQPPGLSTGSFFKNPEGGKSAGQLIDECGLKGMSLGKAKISEHHGNFFMNTGGATAEDVMALGEKAVAAVKERFGIELEREIVFVPAQ